MGSGPRKGSLFWQYFHDVLQDFEVEARIHNVNLSSGYDYKQINEKIRLKDHTAENHNPAYDRMYIFRRKDFLVHVFVNPNKRRPFSFFEIKPTRDISPQSHKSFFRWFERTLSGCNLSSVEYAIDLFSKSGQVLSFILTKSLYVPWQKAPNILGGHKLESGIRSNLVFRYGNTKIYERGFDADKNGQEWSSDDVNRVRLEYTVNRRKLVKHNLLRLSDLIQDSKFLEINSGRWRFRQFTADRLPKIWDNSPSFQEQYIEMRDKVPGLSRYLHKIPEVLKLDAVILDAMISFEKKWDQKPRKRIGHNISSKNT